MACAARGVRFGALGETFVVVKRWEGIDLHSEEVFLYVMGQGFDLICRMDMRWYTEDCWVVSGEVLGQPIVGYTCLRPILLGRVPSSRVQITGLRQIQQH